MGDDGDGSDGAAGGVPASPSHASGGASGEAGGSESAPGRAGDGGGSGAGDANALDADGCGAEEKNCERSDPDCETHVNTVTTCGACDVSCTPNHGTPSCIDLKCVVQPGACEATFGDCDHDGTNGCEAALLSDSNNCGSCGRVCEGATPCTNGMCATVKYATATARIEDYPYFTQDRVFFPVLETGIAFVPRDGTSLPLTATQKDSTATISLTGDATNVYWLRYGAPGTIRRLVTSGDGDPAKANDDVGPVQRPYCCFSDEYRTPSILRSNATALSASLSFGTSRPPNAISALSSSSGLFWALPVQRSGLSSRSSENLPRV
jgi:hypothetical protein